MSLIDFTIDLNTFDPQPILGFEANNNAFLVVGRFDAVPIPDSKKKLELRAVHLKTENLIANGKYVYIKCARYIKRTPQAPAGILLVFSLSNHPVFDWKKCKDIPKNNEFEISANDKIQVHVSFNTKRDCEGAAPIDDGDWPCNKNRIA